eukprot:CAMPEP_0172645988 /NCGR_PEP_ID=MMETSP1068-20121228/240011_1 /TAXON_ID=35684 /ORGANISM="Pseudopedinella elastica, Strain CCMP716" /LENGTH=382 /DNA_ID=CAMNT_0013460237 /DNA_START=425 /DNA_END=1573 /DNA_ORIENTATION=+
MAAKVYVLTYPGLMCFFSAQVISVAIINLLRLAQIAEPSEHKESVRAAHPWAHFTGPWSEVAPTTPEATDRLMSPQRAERRSPSFGSPRSGDARRARRRESTLAAMGALASASLAIWGIFYTYYYPFMKFTSTGLLASFITKNGPELELGLEDAVDGLLSECHPLSYGVTFAFFLYMQLIVAPVLVAVLCLLHSSLPLLAEVHSALLWGPSKRGKGGSTSAGLSRAIKLRQSRSAVKWAVQLVAPWGAVETALVAVFFTAPNVGDVANWVFDDSAPCRRVDQASRGVEECLAMQGNILASGGVVLVAVGVVLVAATYNTVRHRRQSGTNRAPTPRALDCSEPKAFQRGSLPSGGNSGTNEAPQNGALGEERDAQASPSARWV